MTNRAVAPTELVDLDALVRRAALLWGARRAWHIELSDESLSFEDIDNRSWALGEALLAATTAKPGDTVAVMSENTTDFPLTWLALTRRGVTMVAINPRYGKKDIAHVLALSQARAVLVTDSLLERAAELLLESTTREVITLSPLVHASKGAPRPTPRAEHGALSQPANIQLTSGTTGKPKGCVLGHEYWLMISKTLVDDFPYLGETDIVLTAQPFYYIDPQWNVTACLLGGCELIILDGFHPSTFWERVRHYKVTYFYCLGLMPTLLLAMPPSPDDRNHHVRHIEASAIPPGIHKALEERWGVPWLEAFGMTETGADIYVTPDIHDALVGSGSIGIPRPHRAVSIRDESGTEVQAGVTGQMFITGPGMMREYVRNPEATAMAVKDGWFATGDLVEKDSLGHLYHRGRIKDMIRRGGENIASAEVEEVISSYDNVALVAVLGVADELRGEEALAIVVPADQRVMESPEAGDVAIRSWVKKCGQDLASFKVPRYWVLAATLPRSASERILKSEIDAPAWLQRAWDTQQTSDHTVA